MFLASPVKRDKNYEIRLLWYFSILYIRHINDQLFLFLSYFFVCFPTLFLLFLSYSPTFILLFYICLPESLEYAKTATPPFTCNYVPTKWTTPCHKCTTIPIGILVIHSSGTPFYDLVLHPSSSIDFDLTHYTRRHSDLHIAGTKGTSTNVVPMDHLHYRLNFDLDKNFITA